MENRNSFEESLPYGWKKYGQRRENSGRWDFYVISPDNKKLRSNVEIEKYLKNSPKIKCDTNVTNTNWPEMIKKPISNSHKNNQIPPNQQNFGSKEKEVNLPKIKSK